MQKFKPISLSQVRKLFNVQSYTNYSKSKWNVLEIGDSNEGGYAIPYKIHGDEFKDANVFFVTRMLQCKTYGFSMKIHFSIFSSIIMRTFTIGTSKLVSVSVEYDVTRKIVIFTTSRNGTQYWISKSIFEKVFEGYDVRV